MNKIIASLLFLTSLTSCIGGKPAINATSAPQIITTFATALSQLPRGNSAANLPAGMTGITTRAQKSARLSCYTETPATPVDADNDGISLIKEYTMDCVDFTASTYTYNQTGHFKVTDTDDTVAGVKGGYVYEFDIPTWFVKDLDDGFTAGGSFMGKWEGNGSDTLSHYTSDYTGRFYAEFNLAETGDTSVDYTYHYTFDVNYTHDVVADNAAWNNGGMEGKGTFSWDGTFMNESHDGKHSIINGSANMSWEAIGITFDTTCTQWYKSGKIILTDSAANKVEIVYECTTATAYLNGVKIEGVTL